MTKQSEATLKELFKKFDGNGNGKLSLAEIDNAVQHLYPELFSDKRAMMQAYKAADTSQDGFISFSEFHMLIDYLYYYNKLGKEFSAADKDGDHRISYAEFVEGHEKLNVKVEPSQLQSEFNKIDSNKDIMFDEYCNYVVVQKLVQKFQSLKK